MEVVTSRDYVRGSLGCGAATEVRGESACLGTYPFERWSPEENCLGTCKRKELGSKSFDIGRVKGQARVCSQWESHGSSSASPPIDCHLRVIATNQIKFA